MVDPANIIKALNASQVSYIVIGGVAAALYGCPEQTFDLDILYEANPENRERLLAALDSIGAQWDVPLTDSILQRQSVFALNSRFGDLDIFTHVPGLKDYNQAKVESLEMQIEGEPVKVLTLEGLVRTKEVAADPNPRKQSALMYLKSLKAAKDNNSEE